MFGRSGVEAPAYQGIFNLYIMKLKDYIKILQTFDEDVEVVKLIAIPHRKLLKKVKERDIIAPHLHFVYEDDIGKETLIESFVL